MPSSSDWRLAICDLTGAPLSTISRVASKRKLTYRLRQPSRLEFEVPSNDPAVYNTTDGVILKPGRTVKAWRREEPSGLYVIRYAGFVWQVSDSGDEDTAKTRVVCYDPAQMLGHRHCRNSSNLIPADGKVTFTAQEPNVIAEALITRTNAASISGLALGSGTWPTYGARTVTWTHQRVLSAIEELCEGSGLNWYVKPEDRTDGYLGTFFMQDASTQKSAISLGWDAAPHNASRIERFQDMEPLANFIRTIGADDSFSAAGVSPISIDDSDATSQTTYRLHEAIDVYSDLTIEAFLTQLGDIAIAVRKNPRELVKWLPISDPNNPNVDLSPWIDFDLGWLVDVRAGARLRGGFSGTQRIWGWDIDIDDDAVEHVSAIYTGSDA